MCVSIYCTGFQSGQSGKKMYSELVLKETPLCCASIEREKQEVENLTCFSTPEVLNGFCIVWNPQQSRFGEGHCRCWNAFKAHQWNMHQKVV